MAVQYQPPRTRCPPRTTSCKNEFLGTFEAPPVCKAILLRNFFRRRCRSLNHSVCKSFWRSSEICTKKMRIDVDVSGVFSMDVGIVSIDGTICFFCQVGCVSKGPNLKRSLWNFSAIRDHVERLSDISRYALKLAVSLNTRLSTSRELVHYSPKCMKV